MFLRLTRRSSPLALAGGLPLAAAARVQQAGSGSTAAGGEQVFLNRKIFTGRSEQEFASAFKVADGKIGWIGDAADVRGEDTVNLRGRTVLPGFLDCGSELMVSRGEQR
jgi:imidazolonepropionase-like amidohydrolase